MRMAAVSGAARAAHAPESTCQRSAEDAATSLRQTSDEVRSKGATNFSGVYGEFTGWWFGTFFIFPYIEKNHPN